MYTIHKIWIYLIMLLVMTFNGWVFVAIVVGFAIGYLVFNIEDDFVDLFKEKKKVGDCC